MRLVQHKGGEPERAKVSLCPSAIFDHLKVHIDGLEKGKVVHSAGFFLTVFLVSVEIVSSRTDKKGKTHFMNLRQSFVMQVLPFNAVPMTTMPNVEVVFSNKTQAATIAELEGEGCGVRGE